MHVASDVSTNSLFVQNTNTNTQDYINKICAWTPENKIQLNKKKSNAMIFNFIYNLQFTTRLEMEGENIEIIKETKLLGVMVNDRLNWDSNTQFSCLWTNLGWDGKNERFV